MVNARGLALVAAGVMAGCTWRLPMLPPMDAGIDVPTIDDQPSDARDAHDAGDAHEAGDVVADAPQDVQAACPGAADMTAIRVAHFVPDLAAVDICIRRASDATGTFNGPVLAHDQFLPAGVAFQQITGYFGLQPATYTFRIVALGAADCSTAVPGTVDATLTVLPQTYSTLVLLGLSTAAPAATGRLYGDTRTSTGSSSEAPRLRVIHAAPDIGEVLVQVVAGSPINVGQASFGDIGEPPAGSPFMGDCNGFITVLAATNIPLRVLTPPDAGAPLLMFSDMLDFGAVVSAFLTGTVGAISSHPPEVLFCDDRVTSGGYAVCHVEVTH